MTACTHYWVTDGDQQRCSLCDDTLSAADLWSEHGVRADDVSVRRSREASTYGEPPWYVAHAFSILILSAGLAVWLARNVL